MTVQPPGIGPQATPPPASDRHARERRGRRPRTEEERAKLIRTSIVTVTWICGGLAVLFVFFWALGAVKPGNAIAATIVAIVFAVIWLWGQLYRRRHESAIVQLHERERRGY